MAYIAKRDEYQWRARIRRLGYPEQSKTFTTKTEAEAWARLIEGEMDRGIFVSRTEAESTTLNAALDRYSKEITPKKKGASQEMTRIKRWQKSKFEARFLATIKGSDLAKFRDDRRSDGKAENTIRLDLALISHLFETARREWGMESLVNPVKNMTLPRGSKQRDRRLLSAEEKCLFAAFNKTAQPGVSKIVELALETAMRQGEILKLTWKSVDLIKRLIFLADTKNGESRQVPLSKKAVAILSSLPRPIDGGKIFQISQDRLIRTFQRACTIGKADYLETCKESKIEPSLEFLENLRFHDLRHEATTRFFEKGLEMMEVSTITGHKSLQMLRRYTHLRAEDIALKLD